jgi:tetratricopeptide (TPR) repeat protein
VQLLPDDPRGWLLLAEAQLRSNQGKDASQSLARAKQLDPRNAAIWFAEGSLALRNGNAKDAVGLLRQGLQYDNRNAGAYFDLGNAQILLGKPQDAIKDWERAASLRSGFWEAINNQGLVLYEQGDRPAAVARWRRALKIKPDAAEPTLALAAGLYGLGTQHREEAIALADRALTADPNYVLESYQRDQLWGAKLRATTKQLLALKELKAVVERAHANASPEGNAEEDL